MGKNKTTETGSTQGNKIIKEWHWTGTGAYGSLPASTLTAQWLQNAGISHETIAATGLYNPVYEEDTINGNTRTKTVTEDSNRGGNASTGDASSILLENESSGGEAE